MSLFADNVKLLKKIESEEESQALQQNLDRTWEWSHGWQKQ